MGIDVEDFVVTIVGEICGALEEGTTVVFRVGIDVEDVVGMIVVGEIVRELVGAKVGRTDLVGGPAFGKSIGISDLKFVLLSEQTILCI